MLPFDRRRAVATAGGAGWRPCSEAIELVNDGAVLRTTIRGVALAGQYFDALEPEGDAGALVLASNSLCACELTWDMPIGLGPDDVATLACHLVLGPPRADGGVAFERLGLELVTAQGTLRSRTDRGDFEDALVELVAQLPAGVYLRACFGCGLSDYFPAGHGLFGGLACFRDNAAAYRRVSTKGGLFEIWDTHTAYVQETFVCPQFERRTPGTGYRG